MSIPKTLMISTGFFLFFSALAEEMQDTGQLNPSELGMEKVMDNVRNGKTDMMTCASGYYLSKKSDHNKAREVFQACASKGVTGAMTWMSYLDTNGFGGEYNPEAAAEWDRMAAEAGDMVGMFNYGLDLMRGHGVNRNEELGRQYVDKAAQNGLKVARRLQKADYDLDEVTPDSDNWRYEPEVF